MISTQDFKFDISITNSIKGIAICFMMFHHFFGFPFWLEDGVCFLGIPLNGVTLEYYIASACRICIAVYTFLSGYGLYVSFTKKDTLWDWKYLLKKSVYLLINWYLVFFLIELPVTFFAGGVIRNIFSNLFLTDLTGNNFVWYIRFYLMALWTFPILFYLVKKCKYNITVLLLLPFICIVLRKILFKTIGDDNLIYTYILYIPPMITGMVVCKNQYFAKIKFKSEFIAGITVIAVFVIRLLLNKKALSFDCYLSAILVFCLAVLLQRKNKTAKALNALEKHSTNLWYSHAVLLFSGVTVQKVLYAPRIPILILLWGIILCLPGSFVVNFIMHKFKKIF